MPHAIARIAKLKKSNIAAAAQHSRRQRETPNADPGKSNVCLIDAAVDLNLEDLVQRRIGDQPIRKNAVLCVELLLSASPEYFRPDNPAQAGDWEAEQLECFQYAVQQWLTATYGDRIVRADLHLDEATPHVHAYLVPLDERGKLNCFGLFGDRAKLSRFQDSYAAAMASLGLSRGIRGSRATHTQVKEYYAAVTQAPDSNLDMVTLQHQLADRRRVLRERDELEQTARYLEHQNQALQQQVNHLQRQLQTLDRQMVSLEAVAARLGLQRDRDVASRWHGHGIHLTIDGHQFAHDGQTGGGAIALCMDVKRCEFDVALLWLRQQFGKGMASAAIAEYAQVLFAAAPMQRFVLSQSDERQWQRVKAYLTQELRLSGQLIDRLHQQGLVDADQRGKAVFAMRDLESGTVQGAMLYDWETGAYELVGDAQSYFYLCSGAVGESVVVVDSPIEAMSKLLLDQPNHVRGMYLSVAEAQDLPLEWLQAQPEILLALGHDRIASAAWVRLYPQGESWNQDLQHELSIVEQRGKPMCSNPSSQLPQQTASLELD